MVLEKLEKQENFTETEKVIANYLLDPHNNIEGLTSSELGKASFTSQAAVVRLYKKIGIESYSKFYSLLLKELMERDNTRDIDLIQPIKTNMDTDDIIDTITKYYINEIYDTKLTIDKNKIQRLYNYLKSASSVQIYGNGCATFVMKELSNKISTFGIRCKTIETLNEFRLRYYKPTGNVAIFISLNEETELLKKMALTLRQENTYIFGILDNKDNPLKIFCDDIVYISNPNTQNISYYSSVMYIVDVIYSMLLSRANIPNKAV